jgi:hypothetical protein
VPPADGLSKLVPEGKVEVGGEVALGTGFRGLLAMLDHPIVDTSRWDRIRGERSRGGRGEGGERPSGEGGQPPEGRERPEGEQRPARGQRRQGRGRFGGLGMTGGNSPIRTLANCSVEPKITATLARLGDDGIAELTFSGTMAGNGDPQSLGLMPGGRRWGGGQGGDGPMGDAMLEASFEGILWIDTKTHQVQKLVLEGSMNSMSDVVMSGRGREMEISSRSEGNFRVELSTAPAPEETASQDVETTEAPASKDN